MDESLWFARRGNSAPLGPFTKAQLRHFVDAGKLQPTDWLWQQGTPDWVSAGDVAWLFGGGKGPPPPFPEDEVVPLSPASASSISDVKVPELTSDLRRDDLASRVDRAAHSFGRWCERLAKNWLSVVGVLLLAGGLLTVLAAAGMDTTVAVPLAGGDRVHNIGLMHQRLFALILGISAAFAGGAMMYAGRSKRHR